MEQPSPAAGQAPAGLPDAALIPVAAYFQALSEPTRLRLLQWLRGGELSVGELAQRCGSSVANVSRHLTFLTQHGLVTRESRGTRVMLRIADPSVYALCDLVCGTLARRYAQAAADHAAFARITAATPDAVGREGD